MELDSLNDLQEQAILSCQEERSNLENCLVSSPLAVSEKEKLVKKIQLSETKELFKRISVSQVDTLISKEVIDEQTDKIFQIARDYQKFLQMKQNVKSKLTGLKEKMRFCSGCQKYCDVHNQKLLTHAESCFHCSGQNEEFITINRALENDIQTVKEQLINKDLILSKKNELELILLDLKVKKEKLNRKAFSLRQICPVLAEFRGVGDKCINCQKQTQKKHLIKIENPITRVFLIEDVLNIVNPEIYLLTKDKSVCLYNKKDLLRFLTSDSRGKSLLRDKTRSIIYISINY